jgi:hypothetical protein
LRHLGSLKHLAWLTLKGSQVTDAGIAHLKALPRLNTLKLNNAQVTDQCLATLESMKILQLELRNTKISAEGLKRLKVSDPHDQEAPPQQDAPSHPQQEAPPLDNPFSK